MANLEVNFGGMKMRNPIGVTPLNPAIAYAREPKVQADWLMRHVEAGAGYVFISATRPQRSSPAEAKPALKWLKIQCPGFATREALFTTGDIMATQFYLDKTLEVMSIIKKQMPKNVPIIAQPHVSGSDIETWVNLCKVLEEAGADALELNVACPISLVGREGDASVKLIEEVDTLEMRTLRKLGLTPTVGEIPEVLSVITKACVDAVKIPVGVKPSAEAGFPKCVALAKLLAEAGAAWVANITAPLSLAPPNIYDGGKSPWEKVHFPINPFAGVSGPADRYQCYKDTVTIALFVPEIDICAIGGLVNPEHCVEVLMLGAKAVGISSGFMWKGRKMITDSVAFLNHFMDEYGYEKMEDLIGVGLKYVRPVDDSIDWEEDKIAAKLDKGKCTKCGVCTDAFCPVPVKGEDGFPVIDESNCQGCGFCVAICPSGALSIERTVN
jgi:dihydropyrimidine dehydrogenase (NAD+) subunit PreA